MCIMATRSLRQTSSSEPGSGLLQHCRLGYLDLFSAGAIIVKYYRIGLQGRCFQCFVFPEARLCTCLESNARGGGRQGPRIPSLPVQAETPEHLK